MELQTLVEEDEGAMDHQPLEQETQYSSSLDHPMHWGDHVISDTPTLLTHNDEEALNRNDLRDSFMSDTSTGNKRLSAFNVSS